jgi:hypothetical protein
MESEVDAQPRAIHPPLLPNAGRAFRTSFKRAASRAYKKKVVIIALSKWPKIVSYYLRVTGIAEVSVVIGVVHT